MRQNKTLKGEKLGIYYSEIINGFYSHANNNTDNVNTDKIDDFFLEITDIYVFMLEKGVISVETDKINFSSNLTKKYFVLGLNEHKRAILPHTLELILEFLFIQTSNEHKATLQEMFEIYLLSRILPILRPESDCIKQYINFLIEFCSGKTQHYQIAKFTGFIETYKLTDCHILNLIKSTQSE